MAKLRKSGRKSARKAHKKTIRKSKSKTKSKSSCVTSDNKKYQSRPGPPYPAQKCPGYFKSGNDGKIYRSVQDKNGIYKWKKME